MVKRYQYLKSVFYSVVMIILMVNKEEAVLAAAEGIKICLYTLLPSVFPFIYFSILLNNSLFDIKFGILKPISKAFRLPDKAENILLSGFLGGYPVGAQAITDAWHNGSISKSQANRMLGYCSNAGPAFIFGIAATGFSSHYTPWVIWLTHILSALFVAQFLPQPAQNARSNFVQPSTSLSSALNKALQVTAQISGWVIIFRIIIGFVRKWIIWSVPSVAAVWISGILELTNGCVVAGEIQSEGLRFIIVCFFISFGGLCVLAQTKSVTNALGMGSYFPGKILQACFSALLAMFIQPLIIPKTQVYYPPMITLICLAIITIGICFIMKRKKQ